MKWARRKAEGEAAVAAASGGPDWCLRAAWLPGLLMAACLASGCQRGLPPGRAPEKQLAPAYPRGEINDPALRAIAKDLEAQALQEVDAKRRPLYTRVELLPPTQTVQPYGVGAYQQEPRLPVILTTGPGWAGLKPSDREARVAATFRAFTAELEALKRTPALRPTLTIQTPQGIELGWINHLDPTGKNLHGED